MLLRKKYQWISSCKNNAWKCFTPCFQSSQGLTVFLSCLFPLGGLSGSPCQHCYNPQLISWLFFSPHVPPSGVNLLTHGRKVVLWFREWIFNCFIQTGKASKPKTASLSSQNTWQTPWQVGSHPCRQIRKLDCTYSGSVVFVGFFCVFF